MARNQIIAEYKLLIEPHVARGRTDAANAGLAYLITKYGLVPVRDAIGDLVAKYEAKGL